MHWLGSFYARFQRRILSGQAGMWVAVGVLIGIAAGLGSLVLYNLIRLVSEVMLSSLSGFAAPLTGAQGGSASYTMHLVARGFVPVSTTIGGLIAGYMVYRLSPGTEGLGINAAVHAFHNLAVRIKNRTPAVKLVTSAIVIGSGGSAGRDGPVALISAVVGSVLADRFGLDDHDRRIVMASAIGAGFGSIFMAPIGGAIMSTEILYRKDFEVEALIPAVIASVVGYAIFGFQFHYAPLFLTSSRAFLFLSPLSILAYGAIGIFAGLGGKIFVRLFDGVHLLFLKLKRIPVYLKPAIGGLIVGGIGMLFPQILGLGYGWVQMILNGQPVNLEYPVAPTIFFIVLFFLKLIATSVTIGSGGPGGVFAPSLVSGAFLGAAVGTGLHALFPSVSIGEATVVTMLSFFAGVSKTPVAMLIMGTEMVGGLDMFVPLMVATAIAFFTCGERDTIYAAQVSDRLHSPAHMFEFRNSIMDRLTVREAMKQNFLSTAPTATIDELTFALRAKNETGVVIRQDGRIRGYVTREAILSNMATPKRKVAELVTQAPVTVDVDQSVHEVMDVLPADSERRILVVDGRTRDVVGTLGFQEVADAYEDAYRDFKLAQMRHKLWTKKR